MLDRPQALGEGELLGVREVLVVEHQDGVLVHAGMNCGDVRGRQRLRQVDAGDLARKTWTDLADGEGHGRVSTEEFLR